MNTWERMTLSVSMTSTAGSVDDSCRFAEASSIPQAVDFLSIYRAQICAILNC